jgi:hypothetical protein
MQHTAEHAFWLFIAVISIRQTSEKKPRLIIRCVNGDSTNRHSNSFHQLRHYNIFFKPGVLFRTFY